MADAKRTGARQGGDRTAVLRPPQVILDIAGRLEREGFETWCVGGAVRDALLGHAHADWDLATAATPVDVMRLFPRRTVPVGVPHGTVGVLDPSGGMHEVTTFRRDVRTDGRHAEVEFGASLDEDLARRDFTINAIAYSPSRQVLHDPFGGRADLAARVVRAVGTAADRMREDRLRALRALRFAARFEFEIDPTTWRAIVESAPYLGRLSAERVKEELTKTMDQVARPSRALALWRESGALAVLVPPLAGIDPATLASLDCLPAPRPIGPGMGPGAAERAAARSDARRFTRLAALFVGQPDDAVRGALKALRFSNAAAAWIGGLAGGWQAVGPEMERAVAANEPITDATVRRWVAAVGRLQIAPLVRIVAARWAATQSAGRAAPSSPRVAALYRRVVRSAFRDVVETGALAVDGDDLIAAGIAPGPRIGEILRRLLAIVIADPAQNTRERLLALVEARAADGTGPSE